MKFQWQRRFQLLLGKLFVCLVVQQRAPADATQGAQNIITLSAAFVYTNAAPGLSNTLTASDVTTVGQAGALALGKLVSNLTPPQAVPPSIPPNPPTPPATTVSAAPGHTLQYILTATNNGAQNLTTLAINDATPTHTTYVSGACPAVLPPGLSSCNLTAQPAPGGQGALQWTFNGSLTPSAQLTVTYIVKVNQ